MSAPAFQAPGLRYRERLDGPLDLQRDGLVTGQVPIADERRVLVDVGFLDAMLAFPTCVAERSGTGQGGMAYGAFHTAIIPMWE